MNGLKTELKNTVQFVQGNKACAEGAVAAGARFFAGYPITPSSEIAETLSYKLPRVGGKFIQMEDEIGSIGAVLGASLAGLKSITATSGPGFSLMQELIGFASLAEIPCVIVNVQRGGPSTGLPTSPSQSDVMQARWGTHGEHPVVVLAPSSVKEMFSLTVEAFNLSEGLRVPVIVLSDEVVGHTYEKIAYPDTAGLKIVNRLKPGKSSENGYLPYATRSPEDVPAIADFGDGFRFNVTGLIHDLDGFPVNQPDKTERLLDRLHKKIDSRKRKICMVDTGNLENASVVLCSYGATARSCLEVVREAGEEGLDIGIIHLKTLWPFPDFIFNDLGPNIQKVIVCEMNRGQVVREVERISGSRFQVEGVNTARGNMITPGEIKQHIME